MRERKRKPFRRRCSQTQTFDGQDMYVDDAQAGAQQARGHSRHGPAAVQKVLGTGSGAQSSSASKREIDSRELGDVGAFDMDVKEVPRIASLTIAGRQ